VGISSDAITGLIGVVIGSGTTGGFQLWMTHRSERRDCDAAIVLVRADLVHARALIEGADRDPKAWRVVAPPYVTTTVWESYRNTLARDPRINLGILNGAYISILGIQSMIPLGTPDPNFVPQALDALSQAIEHLDQHRVRRRLLPRRPGRPTGGDIEQAEAG